MGLNGKESFKRLTALSAVCLFLLGCMGCGSGTDGKKTIRVVRNLGGREGFRQHWAAWKQTFENRNPDWTMELVDIGNTDGAEYYKSRIATGDLPEIVQTWDLTRYLADSGHLVPLPDGFYEKFGIPLPFDYKGKRYTSQGGIQVMGIAVNKAMWNGIGVTEPPTTWDALIAGLETLKAQGVKPLVFGGREWSAAYPLLYAFQTAVYEYTVDPAKPSWTQLRDEGKIAFATDPTVRMIFEKMIDLLDRFTEKGVASDGYNEEQRDFYSGKGATWMMGCWIAGDIEPEQVDFEIEYWPIPSLVSRPPIFISASDLQTGWAITTSTAEEKQEKAQEVLEVFYDPEVYQLYLNGEGMFKQAMSVPVTGPQSAWTPAQHLFDDMAKNLQHYGTTPGFRIGLDNRPPPVIEMAMARIMQEILAGNHDIDNLLKQLDTDWDNARKSISSISQK